MQRTRTLDGSHENLSLDLQLSRKKSVVAMQACKPRAVPEEGEAGGSLELTNRRHVHLS